ncbi:MAG: hypothetical protein CJBNEKGG_03695 [Prosthecobacter sp.]|nr:hypothetical protein [Prosthecobacter sp.]
MQLTASVCMILQPVPLRSTWLDTNADGTADTWHNEMTGSARNLVSLDSESTDIDGDNATNEEERNYGSDPFVFDTDGDGLSDGDEIHLAIQQRGKNYSLTAWDSDGNGTSDFDDLHDCVTVTYLGGNLPGFPHASYSDYDGDGIKNPFDSHPLDPTNNDEDLDGIPNENDPAPNDRLNVSTANCREWASDALGDIDGDGILNFWDSTPDDAVNPVAPVDQDADDDGIADSLDPAPLDAMNRSTVNWISWYSDALGDIDGDTFLNFADPDPYQPPPAKDDDQDGLNAEEEVAWGTSDHDPDSDHDGLTDHEEVHIYGTIPTNSHHLSQLAGMGDLYNDWELVDQSDQDGDLLPDRVEIHYAHYGLNPADPLDALRDIDQNGLSNLTQYQMGVALDSDMKRYDTDGDGMSDVFEDHHHLNKHDFADAVEDPDQDGVLNYEEKALVLDPRMSDTLGQGGALGDLFQLMLSLCYPAGGEPVDQDHDQNGIPDWADGLLSDNQPSQNAFFFKRQEPGDLDGDGMPDLWEYRYGRWKFSNGLDLRTNDSHLNNDGDAWDNIQEHETWRNPLISEGHPSAPGSWLLATDPYLNPASPPPIRLRDVAPLPTSTSGRFSFVEASSPDGGDAGSNEVIWEVASYDQSQKKFFEGESAVSRMRGLFGPGSFVRVESDDLYDFCRPASPIEGVNFSDPDEVIKCDCHHGESNFFDAVNRRNRCFWDSPSDEVGPPGYPGWSWCTNEDLGLYNGIVYYYSPSNLPCSVFQSNYFTGWAGIRIRTEAPAESDIVKTITVRSESPEEGYNEFSCELIIYQGDTMSDVLDMGFFRSAESGGWLEMEADDDSSPEGEPASLSVNDAAGPRYRKVGLNGIPIPDAKPQVQNENGEEDEETYIDAFSAQLRHAVTDVYAADAACLLPLMVRRDVMSDAWNDRHGLRPSERPCQPFGPGWSSNLGAHIKFSLGESCTTAEVIDEQGAAQRFLLDGGIWRHDGQESRDMKGFMNQLEARFGVEKTVTLNGMTFDVPMIHSIRYRKKFGTVCDYEFIDPSMLVQVCNADRIRLKGGNTACVYARLKTVTDRNGDRLAFSYDFPDTLIPTRIHDPARPGRQMIVQQQDGFVTAVRGPAGDLTTYGYGPVSAEGDAGMSATCLRSVSRNFNEDESEAAEVVRYDYRLLRTHVADERATAQFPNPPGEPLPVNHSNLELSSIVDERGHVHEFAHASNVVVSSTDGRIEYGRPMKLVSVTLPVIGTTRIQVQDSVGEGGMLDLSNIRRVIINPAGSPAGSRPYEYTFKRAEPIPLAGLTSNENSVTIGYKEMQITAPDGVSETYCYDGVEAADPADRRTLFSMLLTCVKDRSQNLTRFAYADRPVLELAGQAPVTLPFPFDDPTTETTMLEGRVITKTMTYDTSSRVMKSITVQTGSGVLEKIKTDNVIDSRGRRTSETVAALAGSGIPGGRRTTWQHAHPVFPGFITQEVVSPLSPVPEVPPVVRYRKTGPADGLQEQWNVVRETVDMDGQSSTTTTWRDYSGSKLMVRDPRGHVTRFEYDGCHRLVKVIHPDDSFRTLAYDPHGNLVLETDELGTSTFHEYDALNRCIKTTLDLNGNGRPDGRYSTARPASIVLEELSSYDGDLVTETAYNRFNLPESVTDTNGVITRMEYDILGRLVQKTRNWRLSPNPADPPQVTRYEYKVDGVNRSREAGGSVFDMSGFKPVQVTDPRGYVTRYEYDSLHRQVRELRPDSSIIHKAYDDLGRVVRVTEPCAANASAAFMSYGAVLTDYDAMGNPWRVTFPGGTTTESHCTPLGRPWKTKDEAGLWTYITHNAAGLPTQTQLRVSSSTPALNPVTSLLYDLSGNPTLATDPLGRKTRTHHDERNRPVGVILPPVLNVSAADSTLTSPVTQTRYDAAGRVKEVVDPQGAITRSLYDRAGRVVVRIDALNQRTLLTYDPSGNVLTQVNALGQTTTNTYSSLGFLVRTEDPEKGVCQFTCDTVGNRLAVQDGNGNITRFAYDAFGRMTEQRFPDNKTLTCSYLTPAVGTSIPANYLDKASQTDPSGYRTLFTYDRRHRFTKSSRQAVAGSSEAYVLESARVYDAAGRLLTVTDKSHGAAAGASITATSAVTLTTSYTYDLQGRVLSETCLGQKHEYRYDLAGNRVQATLKGGALTRVLTTLYDNLNRPLSLTDNNGTATIPGDDRVTSYGYDLAGRAVRLIQANGMVTTNEYDLLGRLKSRSLKSGANAVNLATFSWSHDALGNVLRQDESWLRSPSRQRTTTMSYDATSRLTRELVAETGSPETVTSYVYDLAGNRIQKAVTGGAAPGVWTSTYNASNQLIRVVKTLNGAGLETVEYAYDDNGNRVSSSRRAGSGATQLTRWRWNAWNQLMGVQLADGRAWTYTYDYRMRRVGVGQDNVGGLPARHTGVVFSGGLSVAEFERAANTAIGASTQPSVQYIRGVDMGGGVGGLLQTLRNPVNTSGLPVAPAATRPAVLRYNLSNGRGDIVAQADSAGALTWTASYEAYGKRTKETGANADKQRANSKDEDPTGLLNEGFRYRDLETGVWLSRDPAGFVDGPNLYAYVRQNPWTFWDPDGLAINEKGRDRDENGKWNPNARLFKVTGDPKTGEVTKRELVTSAKDIKTKNATIWVNGMANNEKNAAELGLFHTGKSEFYMVHNPSNGGLSDLGECSLQKLNLRTKVADSTRDILRQFDLKTANVTAHSQGTMILNSALSDLRKEGKDMRGMNITYHGAAANVMLSKRLAGQIGANINVFKGHALDPVHNLVGMNTLNPLRLAGSLVASPLIFRGDRDLSPHSKVEGQAQRLSPAFQSPIFHPLVPSH